MDCSLPSSLSMEFSRQEYWAGLPFPTTRDLPNIELEPVSPAFFSTTEPAGKPLNMCMCVSEYMFRYNHFAFYRFFYCKQDLFYTYKQSKCIKFALQSKVITASFFLPWQFIFCQMLSVVIMFIRTLIFGCVLK